MKSSRIRRVSIEKHRERPKNMMKMDEYIEDEEDEYRVTGDVTSFRIRVMVTSLEGG